MKELLGGCLQAIGILIAGLTGLCTVIVLATVNSWRSFMVAIGSVVSFMAIPLIIGIGMIVGGRALIRSARRERY
jgi:hypothetical protein